MIENLHRHGIKLGVVTTKVRETTERALQMFGLSPYLGTVVTILDVEHPKPHPEPVLMAMKQLGANPATTLMVGDSPADIQAANAAGAISVAVGWSLKGEAALTPYEPKHVIHDMRDLYALVGLEQEGV
ncbi:Pyrophosphatase PpaX [compost metagenome]